MPTTKEYYALSEQQAQQALALQKASDDDPAHFAYEVSEDGDVERRTRDRRGATVLEAEGFGLHMAAVRSVHEAHCEGAAARFFPEVESPYTGEMRLIGRSFPTDDGALAVAMKAARILRSVCEEGGPEDLAWTDVNEAIEVSDEAAEDHWLLDEDSEWWQRGKNH